MTETSDDENVTHTPFCQYSSCNQLADTYDQRHGRLIFFCSGISSGHEPMNFSGNSYNKTLKLQCGGCKSAWRLDEELDSETVKEYECPRCGTEAHIVVNH